MIIITMTCSLLKQTPPAVPNDDPSLVVAAAARVGPGSASGVQLLLLLVQIH